VLPRGELRRIEGAGHMPWFDDPGQVAAQVSHFPRRMKCLRLLAAT
jgi:pimeloyl-ACP methyl ester carboxylesterase